MAFACCWSVCLRCGVVELHAKRKKTVWRGPNQPWRKHRHAPLHGASLCCHNLSLLDRSQLDWAEKLKLAKEASQNFTLLLLGGLRKIGRLGGVPAVSPLSLHAGVLVRRCNAKQGGVTMTGPGQLPSHQPGGPEEAFPEQWWFGELKHEAR